MKPRGRLESERGESFIFFWRFVRKIAAADEVERGNRRGKSERAEEEFQRERPKREREDELEKPAFKVFGS